MKKESTDMVAAVCRKYFNDPPACRPRLNTYAPALLGYRYGYKIYILFWPYHVKATLKYKGRYGELTVELKFDQFTDRFV